MTLVNIAEALNQGARALAPHTDSPRLDAEMLLGQVLGLPRPSLIAHDGDPLAADAERTYGQLIARRMTGTPVAYLTGRREFWSLSLTVSPDVLVPRPETETLVEQALQAGSGRETCEVLDLGTGSGAVALAIAAERPDWNVTGVDVSAAALNVARGNAAALGVRNVEWRLGSWFGAVPSQRFDLIVSNPPYVASGDPALAALAAEPGLALTPGPTGLEALAAITSQSAAHLSEGSWLLLEHAWDQAPAVVAMLASSGLTRIRTAADLHGKSRVTLATLQTQPRGFP